MLNLRQLCEEFLNNLWIPDRLTAEQAQHFALDYFKKTVLVGLKLLQVSTVEQLPSMSLSVQIRWLYSVWLFATYALGWNPGMNRVLYFFDNGFAG